MLEVCRYYLYTSLVYRLKVDGLRYNGRHVTRFSFSRGNLANWANKSGIFCARDQIWHNNFIMFFSVKLVNSLCMSMGHFIRLIMYVSVANFCSFAGKSEIGIQYRGVGRIGPLLEVFLV